MLSDPNAALFTQSYALTHPSQPNYIRLFSGATQGITTDVISSSTPFSTCNLGASLIAGGKTFAGYSEDLPSVGSLAATSGNYARKHCPWTNWQGTGTNRLPSTVGQKFTSFPTSAFSTLPTVSFVIPNLNDDMHNPALSVTGIQNGDTWVYNNMTSYINWAKANNSLLILTFDEDDGGSPNQIATIFIGQMVQGGAYATHINHYTMLRTIEDMYGLAHCDSSAYAVPITNVWKYAPVANFTASASTVCAGQAVTLTDASTNTPTSWTWSMPSGTPASSNLQNPSVTYAAAGTYTISLTAVNSVGSSTVVSKTITVNANPPVAVITPSGNVLSSSAATGNQWYMNASIINGAVNQTYTVAANGSYTVVVTNSFGCSSTSLADVITSDNPPAPNFTASAATVCAGQSVTLTDNSTNSPTSWTWTMPNGSPASSSVQNPAVTYNTAGTYTVTLTASNSFGAGAAVSQTITVNANPAVPAIQITGNVLSSSAATGNQWYLNNVLITGAVNQTYTASANGSYTVEVINSFGCSAGSVPSVLTTTGIGQIVNNNAFTVYPNPANSLVTISFTDSSKNVLIEIMNDLGERVYSEGSIDAGSGFNKTIDMSAFKQGIYLFRIANNENVYTKKVLLIK